MTASNFEKLIWNYLKNYVIGGLAFFFKKETVLLTVYIISLSLLLQYNLISFNIVFLQAIFIILLGLVASKKKLAFKSSVIIITLLSAFTASFYFQLLVIPFDFTISNLYKYYLTVGLLLFWIVFSLTYFIIGIADFFASTAGQFILWGSDKKRIFFTPLPQIAIAISVIYPLYLFYIGSINLFDLFYTLTPIALIIATIYGIFRNKGRILRNSFAMFAFFSVYLSFAYLNQGNLIQGAIINAFLTVVGVLFMMQARLRDIAITLPSGESKTTYTPFAVLTVFGTIMIFLGFITGTQSYTSEITKLWWNINLIGEIISLIAAIVLLYATRRVKKYYVRDNITTKELFLEIGLIIGKKVIDEIVKNLTTDIQEVTKKVVEKSEETIEKIRKSIKDVKDFIDRLFK